MGTEATPQRPAGADFRATLRYASVTADLVAALGATVAAIATRGSAAPLLGIVEMPLSWGWQLGIPFVAVLGAFYSAGLYERDAYMARPLHAWTILRASAWAFVVAAAAAFLAGSGWLNVPRLLLVFTFSYFVPLDMLLRIVFLDRLYTSWVRRTGPVAFIVGDGPETARAARRLARLRGFSRVVRIGTAGGASLDIGTVKRKLDGRTLDAPAPDAVFVDGSSLTPREVLDVIRVAQASGADAYAMSGLLGPLEGSRLLNVLFQTPVTRVRGSLSRPPVYRLKRVLDILGSATALLLLSPLIAVVATIIKATSKGPVFLTQTRVGQSGSTFEFIKFRSMYVDCDSTSHEEYVHALINGNAKPTATDHEGNGVFKIVNDPRITPIGRFIRKFSLDEIPQLWNVLRGDMSLVGPRPPLPYEVREYDDWQRQRLEVQSGITGVWQVIGRNRVSFDEMTFQDLMYGMNRGLWVDVCLCVRTVPAALLGNGL
jgi:exopolysaccharide biosynthesis polyprenyl glycosylphosphotransferase